MKKASVLLYSTAYILSMLPILSAAMGRGVFLILFILPILMSALFRKKGKVVLKKREGNIIAGVITAVFLPLFFLKDVFVIALYYLLLLLSLKLFVSFNRRDYDQVALLSFLSFSLSTLFLYTIWYIVLFMAFALLITLYLFFRTIPEDLVLNKNSVRHIFLVFLSMVGLSLFLFFLLPRNPYMFFGFNTVGESGDFQDVEVGGFNKEAFSERVFLRVKPLKKVEGPLYLRSKVFSTFDGRKWSKPFQKWEKKVRGRAVISKNPGSKSMVYKCFPLIKFSYIPMPEYPIMLLWPGGTFNIHRDLSEIELANMPRKKEYRVFSSQYPPIPIKLENLESYSKISVSLKDYLKRIVDNISFSQDTLRSVIKFLDANYTYGRFISRQDSIPPIVEFLFYSKVGECSEFATAFALLLRILGYKTRLVAGFLTEEFNEIGEYYIVREKHAHAWVEVLKDGRWIRYDPTPPLTQQNSFIERMRKLYDYIQYIWFTRIVEYSYYHQVKAALKVMPYYRKFKNYSSVKKLFFYAILGLIFVFTVSYILFVFVFIPFPQKALNKFITYMKRKGFERKRGETLMELAQRSGDKKAKEFVSVYYEVKFGGGSIESLKQILKSL